MTRSDVDLARVLDEMTDAVIVVDRAMTICYANSAASMLLLEQDLASRPLTDFIPDRYRAAHTAGFARYVESHTGVLVGGLPVRVDVLRADSSEVGVELSLSATTGPSGDLLLVGSMRDMTSTRVLEQQAVTARYLQASMEVAEQLQKADTVDEALPVLLSTLCERLDWDLATLWEVGDGVMHNVDVWHVAGPPLAQFVELTRSRSLHRGEDLPGQVWSIGRPLHVESLSPGSNDPRQQAAIDSGFQSSLVFPLLGSGEVLGVLELYSAERRSSDAGQINVVTAIGKQLGQFLERMRAQDELRRGEERYRSLAEAFALDVFRTSPAGELFTDMPRWRAFTGQSAESLLNMGWADAIVVADRERVAARWRDAVSAQAPYDAEYRITTAAGGERVVLARAVPIFDKGSVREWIGTSSDVTHQRQAERAAKELADTLQRSLLPPHLPHLPGFELAARYQAGGEGLQVGGDFYDVFAVNPEMWVLVIGDVCGKGAEAASVAALARYTVRAAAMHELQPAGIAAALNDALRRTEDRAPFLTAAVAVLRFGFGAPTIEVVCAGHPAPLLRRADGTVEELGIAGDLLGVFDTVELHQSAAQLHAGDVVVFYTDGVIEARDAGGEQLGCEGLVAALARTAGSTADVTSGAVIDRVVAHRGERGGDDVALLAMRCL